jgi:hypothetical protein
MLSFIPTPSEAEIGNCQKILQKKQKLNNVEISGMTVVFVSKYATGNNINAY